MKKKVLIGVVGLVLMVILLFGIALFDKKSDISYLETFTGVGFNPNINGDFREDLRRANDVGLVFFNAPYDGEIPEIIRVGFETGYIDLPVPNMAGSAQDIAGLTAAYLELVDKYQPVFIGLGNEIELMSDQDQFVDAYNDMYAAIKEACSDCIVYPTFHYEQFNPEYADRMNLDLLVFTTYPFARYQRIQDIPDDYYDMAFAKAEEKGVKVAFSEIGWTHLPVYLSGYDSAQAVQAAFYKRFRELISDRPVQFVSWGLLYGSPETGEEWGDLGLYRLDGTPKEDLLNEIVKD